jgi:hypothetical protein
MQDKQKVTLYLPPDLHRKLKVSAAVSSEPMSTLAERALVFYLDHPDVVAETQEASHGRVHRIYNCPQCSSPLVVRDDSLESLGQQPTILSDEELSVPAVRDSIHRSRLGHQGEEELVPC